MTIILCRTCERPFEREAKRGRPAVRCLDCRNADTSPETGSRQEVEFSKLTSTANIETLADEDIDELVVPPSSKVYVPAKREVDNTYYPYRLMVGNLGLAYHGSNEGEAVAVFNSYCRKSNAGFGQVGFERVQLWQLDKLNGYQLFRDFTPDLRG